MFKKKIGFRPHQTESDDSLIDSGGEPGTSTSSSRSASVSGSCISIAGQSNEDNNINSDVEVEASNNGILLLLNASLTCVKFFVVFVTVKAIPFTDNNNETLHFVTTFRRNNKRFIRCDICIKYPLIVKKLCSTQTACNYTRCGDTLSEKHAQRSFKEPLPYRQFKSQQNRFPR